MINKCRCYMPKTSGFTGLCLSCNGIVKRDTISFLDMTPRSIVGTFCNTCRQPYCVCNKQKTE